MGHVLRLRGIPGAALEVFSHAMRYINPRFTLHYITWWGLGEILRRRGQLIVPVQLSTNRVTVSCLYQSASS